MITCNRCGRPNPEGAASCQHCGMLLASNAGRGTGPNMAAPSGNMPELPAWLETLRSSERPGAPATQNKSAGSAYNFSASELIDEGMLPSWMNPNRSETSDTGHSQAYSPGRPASRGAPNTDNFAPSQPIMSASSLIDEQSLPEWMKAAPSSQAQQQPQSAGIQDNIPAASLLQSTSLPEWMRAAEPPTATPAPSQPHYEPMPVPPEGIMGSDLIDPQSLPQWMSGQGTSAPLDGQKGFSASALLDESALPPWLRNASQDLQRGNGMAFPSTPQAAQAAPFPPAAQPLPPALPPQSVPPAYSQPPQPAAPAPFNSPGAQPSANNSLSASSFIDMQALPDWLKPAGEQQTNSGLGQQQQGISPMGRPANVPSRPENVRVPSRPRAEMGPYEENEVAANVFASMLGVASAAPNLPGQARGQAAGTMPPVQQQPMPPQQQPQWINTGQAGYPGPQYPPMPPAQQMNGGYNVGNVPMPGNMPPQQGRPMNGPGGQGGGAAPPQGDENQAKPKAGKRGFLSTILEWFSFSR